MLEDKVVALIIIYNNDGSVIENVHAINKTVDTIYIFDNTEEENRNYKLIEELNKINKLIYLSEGTNRGLAYPINKVAEVAYKNRIKWLITFDQDSIAEKNMILNMREFIENYPNPSDIAIVGPLINDGKTNFGVPASPYSYCDKIIQSGALHNLDLFFQIGGYDNKLFIDQVDYEFCARAILHNYKIIRVHNAVLKHNVKDDMSRTEYIKGKKIIINKYTASRYYYIFRNNLYCYILYKRTNKYYSAECKLNMEKIVKTIRYDNQKITKIFALIKAFRDGITNNFTNY